MLTVLENHPEREMGLEGVAKVGATGFLRVGQDNSQVTEAPFVSF